MAPALQLVIAAGLFSLGGVVIGALLTTLTQLYLERKREQRAADQAKLLVAGELLHAQLVLGVVSKGEHWPVVENVDAFLPTSAWRENRTSMARKVDEDLWDELVMAYAVLEYDRARFVAANRLPALTPLPAKVAEGIREAYFKLGSLRGQLGGGGGGWLDEIHHEIKPRMDILNDNFRRWLDGLSDDDLKKNGVSAKVKQTAKEIGELNQEFGDDGTWSTEINTEINRRLK
jgi:hypothetical protein